MGYMGDSFTGQKTQPTEGKASKENPEKYKQQKIHVMHTKTVHNKERHI